MTGYSYDGRLFYLPVDPLNPDRWVYGQSSGPSVTPTVHFCLDHLDHPPKPLVRAVRVVRVILDHCLDHYRGGVVAVILAAVATVALALAATVALIRDRLSRAVSWRDGIGPR